MQYKLSQHALTEMQRRNIPLDLLESVMESPQQIVIEREGKKAYQSKLDFGDGKIFLLRVIVMDDSEPTVVVTV